MKVVFVLSYSPVPRIHRRINCFNPSDVSLFYWNRITTSNKEKYLKWGCKVFEYIDTIKVGNPLKRIPQTLKYVTYVKKNYINEVPDIVFLQDMDMLLFFSNFFKKKNCKVVYEIRDLHSLQTGPYNNFFNRFIGYCIRKIEKKLLRNVDLMTITSDMFYDNYYKGMISRERTLYIPNCPDERFFDNYMNQSHEQLTVGFIGMIRYEKQIKMLVDVSNEIGINVFIAGEDKNKIIENYVKDFDNVTFFGSYDYEKDISALYEKIDIVYSVYDSSDNNVKIALPNRLYEGIYLGKPIIAAKNTYLGKIVSELGVGMCVDSTDPADLRSILLEWVNNKEKLQKHIDACMANRNIASNTYYQTKLLEKLQIIEE